MYFYCFEGSYRSQLSCGTPSNYWIYYVVETMTHLETIRGFVLVAAECPFAIYFERYRQQLSSAVFNQP